MTTYEVLTSNLRVKPTFTSAEEVIRKDFKLKLPSRRYIHLWNTPEISQFRGYQDLLDETEERKHAATVTRLEIQQTARQTNQPSMDAEIVQEMMQNQKQSSAAMAQHMRDMAEHTRRENAGMAAEQRASLQHLANAHAQAQNLQRISETALTGLMRDTALEQRNLIQDLAAKAGHVTNNIDSRHFETHNHHNNTTQMTDVNVHNQAMNLMQTHTQQLGVLMQQNQIGHERMQQGLYNTIMQQQKAQASIPPQIVLHMAPPPPMAIMPFQPPPGPPPPPAAGAIAIPVMPRPAPLLKPEFIVKAPMPTPAPTIQPEKVIRNQTEEVIRKQQRELDSYNRTRKADKPNRVAPWNSGIANPPTLPPPIATPAVLPEAPTAPGAAVVLPTDAPPAPLPAAPLRGRVQQRAPRSIAAQSTRYAPTEGTREESVDTTRSRSRSVVRTARAPRVIRPKPLAKAKKAAMSILTPQAIAVDRKPKQVSFKKPEEEEDDKPPPPRRRRITKKEPPPQAEASKNRRAPTPRGTVSSKGVYSKIRVVPLESAPEEPKKRGRGRPKGSLGVKNRAMQKT
jgi:hypothetical protein